MYAKTLVNLSGKFVGNNAFWLPVFRSTRTFTPVMCPWATSYFLWSMNRLTNRKIYACCWGNSACMLLCCVSHLMLIFFCIGMDVNFLSFSWRGLQSDIWAFFSCLLISVFNPQPFPSGNWSGVCRNIFMVPVWKTFVLPSKWKFFCLFCLFRDMWVLSSGIWVPWWRAASLRPVFGFCSWD